MTLLAVDNLSLATAAKTVVEGVSFTIEAQKTLAITGPSGAGKTLTALALLNLLPPGIRQIAGAIAWEGASLAIASKPQLRHLRGAVAGFVFQDANASLNPLQRIGAQLAESLRLHGDQKPRRETLLAHLTDAGFKNPAAAASAYPHQLSGGERQRAMLAIALANDPKLLIADEPTASLDSHAQAAFFERLTNLRRAKNLALLLITHDLNLIRRHADHILILDRGRIVESGPTETIFSSLAEPRTRILLTAPSIAPPPPPAPGAVILQVQNLAVTQPIITGPLRLKTGQRGILENISFSIRAGETLGLIGPSGAGKSTIALAILNLMNYRGEISFNGENIKTLSRRRAAAIRQIVFQNPFSSLSPRLTIADIVTEGLAIHAPHLTAPQRREKFFAALDDVGLPAALATRTANQLSGGEAQRAAIARALINHPQLLILDEPTSSLDAAIAADILRLLRRLQQSHRLACLFISHDLAVIRAVAHRVIMLENGRIIATGDAPTMLSHQHTAYAQALANQRQPI